MDPAETQSQELRKIILERADARRARERQQRKLWREDDDHKETIRSKLDGLLETNQFYNFARCGREQVFKTCRGCHAVTAFEYQCNLKWCPRCSWRITERRRKVLELWSQQITQPKHLVLTQKNFWTLTPKTIRAHTKNLARFRRTHVFDPVRGGCVSVEITNEQRGWHLHSHWLLDVRWLDIREVSRVWGRIVGQSFAVVKIMDCRDRSYLQEVTKYVVEGSEMAKWSPEHILEFVTAIRGRRFFFPFGSLFKLAAGLREQIEADKPHARPCECGCADFIIESEQAAVLAEVRRGQLTGGSAHARVLARAQSPRGDAQSKEAGDFLPAIEQDKTAGVRRSSVDGVGPHH